MNNNLKQKKVALVLAGNIENAPYLRYYTDVLVNHNIICDVIAWDRISLGSKGTYCYRLKSVDQLPFYRKMIDYARYSRFVKTIISDNDYDVVVIFTVPNIIFLGSFLAQRRKPFMIDIRDYSPLMRFSKKRIKQMLHVSGMNVISSPGFKSWLPQDITYEISHNIQHNYLLSKNEKFTLHLDRPLRVTSFGLIRDYPVYKKLLTELKNSPRYSINIVGPCNEPLQEFALNNGIANASFGGRYEKEQEQNLVTDADFIFILLPRSIAHDFAMANRFYQALVKHRPMIVNEGSVHVSYIKAYHLGVVMTDEENIASRLDQYINNFDNTKFNEGCNQLIYEINNDIQKFEKALIHFVNS